MTPIPPKLREEMSNDPFYKKCCVTGTSTGKIDWHNNLIFGGKQVQAKFCILPLAKSIHDHILEYKEICDWIMWSRATDQEVALYSKAENYKRTKERLIKKYGIYTQGKPSIN